MKLRLPEPLKPDSDGDSVAMAECGKFTLEVRTAARRDDEHYVDVLGFAEYNGVELSGYDYEDHRRVELLVDGPFDVDDLDDINAAAESMLPELLEEARKRLANIRAALAEPDPRPSDPLWWIAERRRALVDDLYARLDKVRLEANRIGDAWQVPGPTQGRPDYAAMLLNGLRQPLADLAAACTAYETQIMQLNADPFSSGPWAKGSVEGPR